MSVIKLYDVVQSGDAQNILIVIYNNTSHSESTMSGVTFGLVFEHDWYYIHMYGSTMQYLLANPADMITVTVQNIMERINQLEISTKGQSFVDKNDVLIENLKSLGFKLIKGRGIENV